MNYDDAFDIGSIQLEPRLQEYLRTKKFNMENDIEPQIPEEQEFNITPFDLKIIKKYNQGEKNIYTAKRLSKDPHFVKPIKSTFQTDNDFKSDPRYKRLQKKMQSHKDARSKMNNLEGIDDDYVIFHQSNPYDLKSEIKPSKISKPYHNDSDNDNYNDNEDNKYYNDDLMVDSRDMLSSSDYSNKYMYNPNRTNKNRSVYNHPPKLSYKQYVTPQKVIGGHEHSRTSTDIIGDFDSYNKHLNKTYEYIDGNYDSDTLSEGEGDTYRKYEKTPGTRSHTQREMTNTYRPIPFMYGNGLPDISLEESLRGGYKDSSRKSIGFKNPFENQFSYIDKELSNPDHTVQMWPQQTRGRNREIARPNSLAMKNRK